MVSSPKLDNIEKYYPHVYMGTFLHPHDWHVISTLIDELGYADISVVPQKYHKAIRENYTAMALNEKYKNIPNTAFLKMLDAIEVEKVLNGNNWTFIPTEEKKLVSTIIFCFKEKEDLNSFLVKSSLGLSFDTLE